MEKQLKITLLLRYFTIGGLERVVSALANEYVKHGINTEIVVLSKGKRNSLITEIDPRVSVCFLSGNYFNKAKMLRQKTKERLVHIHFGDGKIHPLIRLSLQGRKKVLTYHSVYSHKRNKLLNVIDFIFSKSINSFIAVSDAVKDFCSNEVHINRSNIHVIHNGIFESSEHIPICDFKENRPITFLSLASLYPHKNHSFLIELLARLKHQYKIPFICKVIGDGPCMADLYLKSVELGIDDSIIWYGAVWHKDIVTDIIKTSDVFVSASKYEGFPISILEGMSYGLPMVLSDIKPHKEITQGQALFFSPVDGIEEFCDSIKRLYDDNQLRNNLSEESLRLSQLFNLEETIEKHIEVYKSVI